MPSTLDLFVAGDVAGCRQRGLDLQDLAALVGEAAEEVQAARLRTQDTWTGLAADQFISSSRTVREQSSDVVTRLVALARGFEEFSTRLEHVEHSMVAARERASAAGLHVGALSITAPDAPLDPMAGAQDPRLVAWAAAVSSVDTARSAEDAAHAALQQAVSIARADGSVTEFLRALGILPADGSSAAEAGLHWLTKLTDHLGTAALWAGIALHGEFRPRFRGRYRTFESASWIDRFRPSQYQARWGEGAARAPWTHASKVFGKVLGPIGSIYEVVHSGVERYESDADDPRWTEDERLARVGTTVAVTAAAVAGGAAIVAACTVGAPVLVVVGVGVGVGVAATAAAGVVNDVLMDNWDGITSTAGDAAYAVGGAVSDVADALTFWD